MQSSSLQVPPLQQPVFDALAGVDCGREGVGGRENEWSQRMAPTRGMQCCNAQRTGEETGDCADELRTVLALVALGVTQEAAAVAGGAAAVAVLGAAAVARRPPAVPSATTVLEAYGGVGDRERGSGADGIRVWGVGGVVARTVQRPQPHNAQAKLRGEWCRAPWLRSTLRCPSRWRARHRRSARSGALRQAPRRRGLPSQRAKCSAPRGCAR